MKFNQWKKSLPPGKMHWKLPFPLISFHPSFPSFITFAKDNWEDRGIGRVCGNLMCFIFKYFSVFLLNVAMYWKKLKKENITRKEQEEAKKKIEYISNRNASQVQIVLFPPLNSVFGSWKEWPCLACRAAADGPCRFASIKRRSRHIGV